MSPSGSRDTSDNLQLSRPTTEVRRRFSVNGNHVLVGHGLRHRRALADADLSRRPRRIEPEAIDAMSLALSEEACKARHTNGQAHEVVATRIIDLARSGVMDAKAPSERVIAEVKAWWEFAGRLFDSVPLLRATSAKRHAAFCARVHTARRGSLSKQMLGASQRSQGTLIPRSPRRVRL